MRAFQNSRDKNYYFLTDAKLSLIEGLLNCLISKLNSLSTIVPRDKYYYFFFFKKKNSFFLSRMLQEKIMSFKKNIFFINF